MPGLFALPTVYPLYQVVHGQMNIGPKSSDIFLGGLIDRRKYLTF
jgi:hypothetical protein